MPELPEVETIVRHLKSSALIGAKVLQAKILWKNAIETAEFFIDGSKITDCKRLGKWIVICLDSGNELLIHLRMSGRLFLAQDTPLAKHIRAYFPLDDGRTLFFHDTRKFGRLALVTCAKTYLTTLGHDPLDPDWDQESFIQSIKQSTRMIKALLLDQKVIAGLGNIYVDEALFRSQIFPETKGYELRREDIKLLAKEIIHVLQEAIEHQGTSLGTGLANFHHPNQQTGSHQNHLKAYGRQGLPCLVCQTRLLKIQVSQRGSTYCPNCQKKHAH